MRESEIINRMLSVIGDGGGKHRGLWKFKNGIHSARLGGVREGFLEMTMPALRPEGDKPGLESRRYGRLALEGCWAVLGK